MANQQHGDDKKQGDALRQAMHDFDRGSEGREADPVPVADSGSHSHSHAAHLSGGEADTKRRLPDLRRSPAPGALREPPANVQRIGKQHRGQ